MENIQSLLNPKKGDHKLLYSVQTQAVVSPQNHSLESTQYFTSDDQEKLDQLIEDNGLFKCLGVSGKCHVIITDKSFKKLHTNSLDLMPGSLLTIRKTEFVNLKVILFPGTGIYVRKIPI